MNNPTVALYARVSTSEQAENGHSIDEQQERMRKYCESFGWNVYDVYVDAGFSGANMARPALTSLIKAVKSHKVDKVLVWKLDRLSRSQKDTLNLIEDVFLANDVDFISMNENFDTSTAFGRAMVGILAVFAQLEREQIKERMAMGREARAKAGKHRGSAFIPIGYDYVDGNLVTNDFEAMQVKCVFDMFSHGKSVRSIVKYLNERGYVHKYGQWNTQTVRNCLSHEVYLGKIVHKGKTFPGNHEAIISQDIFDRCAALREDRHEEHEQKMMRTGKVQSFLGGYLICGKCGAKMAKRTKTRGETRYEKYECLSRWKVSPTMIKDPDCKNKIWNMKELDDIVFIEIKKLSVDETYRNNIVTSSQRQSDAVICEIKKLDEQLSKIMDMYLVGSFPAEMLKDKTEEISSQKNKLEKELEKLLDKEKSEMSKEETSKLLASFSDILDKDDFEEIRLVIGALIDHIEVNDDDVTIFWKFT